MAWLPENLNFAPRRQGGLEARTGPEGCRCNPARTPYRKRIADLRCPKFVPQRSSLNRDMGSRACHRWSLLGAMSTPAMTLEVLPVSFGQASPELVHQIVNGQKSTTRF